MNEIKPNGCKDWPQITFNPSKSAAPAVWNPRAGYCIDAGTFDPRCAFCRWRGVGRVAPTDFSTEGANHGK